MSDTFTTSIIIINYKQAAVTNALLNSLDNLLCDDFEIIVVDNNSGEEDVKKLCLDHANMTLIQSDRNLGFAGGNNLGIKAASGKYILLLNNDTEVDANFLQPMIRVLEQDSSIGAVSPLILYHEQPDTIQYAGYHAMNPLTLRMSAIGQGETNTGQYSVVRDTPFAHGCAMLLPAMVIADVGLMEERYFLYYEEHDWCQRIRKAGYSISFQPQSKVYHKESISTGKNSTLKTYFLTRNRILFMKRNYNVIFQLISMAYLVLFSIPVNTIKFISRRKTKHLSAYWDALIWNLTHKTKERWILS